MSKLLVFVLFSFFIISNIKVKTFFKNNCAKLFNLKHEIILCQKEKRSKMLQVKVISKDVRKTIVPSFMFLFFNLSKSVVLCVKEM